MTGLIGNGAWFKRASLKSAALIGVSGAALALTSAAFAQGNQQDIETVVVSSSRLTAAGFNAPTPTQVVGAAQIEQAAYPSVFDSVAALPALEGNASPVNGNGNNSNGQNGLSTLNARGLGPVRTLVLIDGQRVEAANINGVDDIGLFPQLLIQRVDVVTGGASAGYGSDAVAGVVNFIMNKSFTGFKANVEGGITNYGDDASGLVQAAWGTSLLGDKVHLEVSGEYYKNGGVPSRPYGLNGGPNGRTWFKEPGTATRTVAATPAGQPENQVFVPAQNNTYSLGGLITAGPLKGTAFGPNGTIYQYQYGANCVGSFCDGGENTQNVATTSAWDAKLQRATGFYRLGYDLTDDINVYMNVSYAEVKTQAQVNQGAAQQGNLTIQCDNAFLPAAIVTACATNKITSFAYGTSNLNFPQSPGVTVARKQPRYVFGFNDKKLSIGGTDWNVQAYYQHGETHELLNVTNSVLIPRYKAAIDAVTVTAANQANYPGVAVGTIVCRLNQTQAPGCVPYNVIGFNQINPNSWAYFNPPNGPFAGVQQHQDVASFAVSGSPFKNWAGDVNIAFGGEWRLEAYHQVSDWYGAGISATSPINAKYPADPVLLSAGNNYYAGSFFDGSGSYNVKEGFLEIGMPLFDNSSMGKLDLDVAGRFTNYSTSGDVSTWKVGGTWDTPVNGIRLRAVASRDVRAPNLSELFPAPLSSNNTITNRINVTDATGTAVAGAAVNVAALTIGNPQLTPEKADNIDAGIVFQPDWIPGFQASFDYHSIKINKGIFTSTPQQVVDLCQIAGNAQACANVKVTGVLGTPTQPFVNVKPFNLSVIYTSGYDVEASYQMALADLGLPGDFSVQGKASHVNTFVINPGLPLTQVNHDAGLNGANNPGLGTAPKWKGLLNENWTFDKLSITGIQRFISAGYVSPDNIECQNPNCPLPTIQNPTINYNHLPGAIYFDASASYQLTPEIQVYGKVENIADHNPPVLGTNGLYDWLGRFYRIGIRIND
jgi:outer membrane receptor protein involved in Fe transport